MKKKYKLTGFARLTIFLLLFMPIAYTVATFIQGENPIEAIKEKLHIENFVDRDGWKKSKPRDISNEDLQLTISSLQERVDKLETEVLLKDTEIKALKSLIENQKTN